MPLRSLVLLKSTFLSIVPVPRRFDRRPPERDTTRINERIRVPKVRLIGADGEQLGIVDIAEALKRAQDADLDLVEVAPDSKPPVTRLLDYSKYKYEQEQKQKAARKHQQQVNVREIKLRPKIADHDYETKKGHVERFLKHQRQGQDHDHVPRPRAGPPRARPGRCCRRLFEDLDGLAVIESAPLQEGRNMSMLLAPSKEVDKVDDAAKATTATTPTVAERADDAATAERRQSEDAAATERSDPCRRPRPARRAITSAIRSAAWPSQSGGGSRAHRRAPPARPGSSAIAAGSRPSRVLVPARIVTGRSVLSRRVKQGTPR